MAAFPTFGNREDSSKFGFDTEDVGLRGEMEGGYVLSRPRHTRRPRRTWTTGFTALTQPQFDSFLDFWNEHGTFKGFTYVVRTSNEVVNVRFSAKPVWKYTGVGATFMWDISELKLEEI